MSKNNLKQRRDFLRTLVAGGAAGALGSMGQLALMREASAASPGFSDYKAMVCVFLYGGNDSFNMIMPSGTDVLTGHPAYAASRGELSVANTPLAFGDGTLSPGAGNPYYSNGETNEAYLKGLYNIGSTGLGINGVMPEFAHLVANNKASVMSNIGNLVRPVTRAGIKAKTADLPLFLFAHNHQQRALQTGQGNNLNDVGWAGKIADDWAGINSDSPLGLNISYAGSDRMLVGNNSVPLAIGTGTPPRFADMYKNVYAAHSDRRALFKALAGDENTSITNKISFGANNTFKAQDPFASMLGASSKKSMAAFDLLYESLDGYTSSYTSKDSYGNDLFTAPTADQLGLADDIGGRLLSQLGAVAKMIEIGATSRFGSSEYNRQIFMVSLGGFDTHSEQDTKHPLLLRELSLALSSFQKALDEKGHSNKVTTFTMSDFGRTLGNNGDGTDHAWGAHHLVMGGDGGNVSGNFNGGQVIGTLPEMVLDGNDDYSDRGRIIPTTAQDQLNASLCRWFGVDDSLMPTLFPNLANFGQSPGDLSSAYLDELFVT